MAKYWFLALFSKPFGRIETIELYEINGKTNFINILKICIVNKMD